MLGMIQKIFYGPESTMVVGRIVPDLGIREHVILWPMVVLMLVMGVYSPYWMVSINGAMAGLSDHFPAYGSHYVIVNRTVASNKVRMEKR